MCMWGHVYATAYICYVWAEDNFVSGPLLTFLFSLELNLGFQACAVNLLTHRTIHYLTSHVFTVCVSPCCSVAVKLTM